ncbi:sensor histidine kinase [Campylobacter sp. faydin G-24]|uniref:histidine kinase n=1 Tax=Campylobacter anatolicus TaxID=2829105 RepID=A0ABS5HGG6_9BACT|nr:sensor histidine kinase [Campylobacter anatolicus]MBR8463364.1 sensor histidine kinase [Campylobacter anatolicus]
MNIKKGYLTTIGIFAILILYLGLLYLNYENDKNALQNLSQNNQINLVKLYKQRLEEWLESKKRVVALAKDSLVELEQTQKEQTHKVLQDTAKIGEFDSVYVGYEDDGYIINTDILIPYDYKPTKREWYKSALDTKEPIITLPYEDAFITGNIRFSVVAHFKTRSNILAVVSADMVFDKIQQEILNINKNLKGFAFLLTKAGEVIVSPSGLNLKPCGECKPAISLIMQNLNDENLRSYVFKNENFILFYEPLKNSDWIFAVSLNESKILSTLETKFKTDIVLALTLALIGIGGWVLLNLMTSRVRASEQIMLNQSKIVAMGEMLVATTHQLKQPLAAMNLNIDMAKMHLKTKNLSGVSEKLDKTGQIIGFMQNSIDSFKNFYKPNNKMSKIDLIEIINDVFSIIRQIMRINNIELNLLFEHNKRFIITTHPNYIKQILLNLLSNAKDAIVQSGKNGEISVRISDDESKIYISVSDNGVGISKKIKLFKESQTTKKEGSGNGLYICKLLAKKIGGQIYLKSRVSPTSFEFTLNKDKK